MLYGSNLWLTLAMTLAFMSKQSHGTLFDCKVTVDGTTYDVSPLSGLHEVPFVENTPPTKSNLSWFINPCGSLAPGYSEYSCDSGTQVCGINTVTLPNNEKAVTEIIPLVSEKDGEAPHVKSTEKGVSISLNGGQWGDRKNLSLVLNYECTTDKDESGPQVVSWNGTDLNLRWKTSLVCAKGDDGNKDNDNDKDKDRNDKNPDHDKNKDGENGGDGSDDSGSWGWFTWFFILFVLAVSFYVIGSAWVNYNQHGLTGVELLPHSDTLRDLPYLLRDLVNKMVNTFASGSSRAGYSAV